MSCVVNWSELAKICKYNCGMDCSNPYSKYRECSMYNCPVVIEVGC
jgi:hypothetical protein